MSSAEGRRARLDPATARIRTALREALARAGDPERIVLGVSGGADSMALAAAAAFLVHGRHPVLREAHAVFVDHGLQAEARAAAETAAAVLADRGLSCEIVTVAVDRAAPEGLEAAARRVRLAALDAVRAERGAALVLLAHTLDDQAETVLLGLARGSGGRALAGMREHSGALLRPLLAVRRSETVASCAAQHITVWDDPMNRDPAHTRVRVRHRVLPVLAEQLDPGVVPALARTAEQLAEDADELDRQADVHAERLLVGGGIDAAATAQLPPAIRRRVLRRWLLAAGVPAQDLGHGHLLGADGLLSGERTGALSLPGGLVLSRQGNHGLLLASTEPGVHT